MPARFKPKPDALYELRRSPEVRALIDDMASRIASSAGSGFEWSSQQGARNPSGRWRAIVYPATHSARAINARDNVLVRALGSGGV